MKSIEYFIIVFLTLILLQGCKNDFDPLVKGEYNDLMIFSVLDTRKTSQEVLVQKAYQTLDEKVKVKNCEIKLVENDTGYYSISDSYSDGQYIYYSFPDFKLNRGSTYEILVIRDSMIEDKASVKIQYPPVSKCSIYVIDRVDWTWRGSYKPLLNAKVDFSEKFLYSKNDCYYTFKTYIEYDKIENGISKIMYVEVYPAVQLLVDLGGDPAYNRVPQVLQWPKSYFSPGRLAGFSKDKIASFTYDGYTLVYSLQYLSEAYDHKDITIKRMFTVSYTIDEKFYNAFITKNWEESISSRFDLRWNSPDIFTNSNHINGFFGAITCDTVSCYVPQEIIDVWGYNNRQK